MTSERLLSHVESLGVVLTAEGDRLRVSAPLGSLTDDLKAAIAGDRDGLLALVAQRAPQPAQLPRIDRAGPLPLSSFQERLWILQRMDPASVAYNTAHGWRNTPGVGADAVVSAVRALVERHEILRCSFDEVQGVLAARALGAESVRIEVRDLTALPDAEKRPMIVEDLSVEVRKPFDLRVEPPVRFLVYRTTPAQTTTMVIAHHIAVDDWSLGLIEKEIAVPPKVAPRLQYADYAAWQRTTLTSAAADADLEWWSRYLAGAPQLSALPPDLPPTREVTGATRRFSWDPELTASVRSLARKEGATLYMALLAACALTIRWHTGQEDFVCGSPLGARESTELEDLIGPFVNLLLVRLEVSGNPTFGEVLRRARDSMLAAHEHRHVPFEALLERVKPARSLEHTPLFQIAIVQHNSKGVSADSQRASGGAIHEITWFVRELPTGLESVFDYRADLYSPGAIDRFAAHVEAVLRRAVEVETRPLTDLAVLPEAEVHRLLEANATGTWRVDSSFPVKFERQVEARPAAVALACGTEILTYAELNQRANVLAQHLRGRGVTAGSRVAVYAERSPSLVVALLAIQKAGGVYVPLDPAFPVDRVSFMLQDSGAGFVLTANTEVAKLALPVAMVHLDVNSVDLGDGSATEPLPPPRPEDAAYIIYTSGSTGLPKGVTISHGSLLNLLESMAREPGLHADDVLAAVTTVSFDIAGLELYLPLLVGARVELVPREVAADGVALGRLLDESSATVLQATPATWRMLVEAGWRPAGELRGFCGGESLPRELAAALLDRLAELWNLYGPTETTIWSTCARVERGGPITVGHPITNTIIMVASADGQLRPIGAAGEIWIGGAGVAIGYHDRPELTAERFVTLAEGPYAGKRFYRTGDLGRWLDNGHLEHLGRLDQQVKIRGFRVELGEIESVLASHPAVRQALVIAYDVGAADRRLVAFVVYQPGEDPTVSEMRRHLRVRLPEYMIPAMVVGIDTIPLTPNGKLDRAALPDPFRGAAAADAAYEPPQSAMEQLLADVWKEVLKVARVGVRDNFFELGGHSLLSLRVATAVQARTGWRLDPRTLFFQNLSQIAATGAAAIEDGQLRPE